jgi:hypothetical protein
MSETPWSSVIAPRGHAPQNYSAPAARSVATNYFEVAVKTLLPWTNAYRKNCARVPNLHTAIVELLGNRAQYGAIHGWRFGRRKAPQWACDLLAQHLRREAHERLVIADLLSPNKKGAP